MGRRGNGVFAGTLLLSAGAFLGAGAALLLAPKTGKTTRKELNRYAKKAINGAEGAVEEFADTVTGMVEAVGDTAESILDRGKHIARGTKKELIGAIEGGQKQLGRQKARLEKLIA